MTPTELNAALKPKFAELLQETKVSGSFFLRTHLQKQMAPNELDEFMIANEISYRAACDVAKTAFNTVYTFEQTQEEAERNEMRVVMNRISGHAAAGAGSRRAVDRLEKVGELVLVGAFDPRFVNSIIKLKEQEQSQIPYDTYSELYVASLQTKVKAIIPAIPRQQAALLGSFSKSLKDLLDSNPNGLSFDLTYEPDTVAITGYLNNQRIVYFDVNIPIKTA